MEGRSKHVYSLCYNEQVPLDDPVIVEIADNTQDNGNAKIW
jgi:hypothetical protein